LKTAKNVEARTLVAGEIAQLHFRTITAIPLTDAGEGDEDRESVREEDGEDRSGGSSGNGRSEEGVKESENADCDDSSDEGNRSSGGDGEENSDNDGDVNLSVPSKPRTRSRTADRPTSDGARSKRRKIYSDSE
jgi:hypothetical protein